MKRTLEIGRLLVLLLGIFAVATTVGCKRSSAPGATGSQAAGQAAGSSGTPTAAAIAEAARIFTQRCVSCHGEMGKGDGPASAALNPKPRDFTSAEWQKTITDDHLDKIIVYGGAAVGKSAAMPSNPDLNSKADVVAALRLHVRGLSGK